RRILHRGLLQRQVIATNVRIREAITALGQAESPQAVLSALEHAISGGDFVRAELWLPERAGRALAACREVERVRGWYHWSWAAEDQASEELWELMLPFRGPGGVERSEERRVGQERGGGRGPAAYPDDEPRPAGHGR